MEKIYVGHSTSFDYRKELYEPIRKSRLNSEYNILLPHEASERTFNSKEALRNCKIMIAEVSYHSLGLGIEVGWADSYGVPIIFIFKKGSKISRSLKHVSSFIIEYESIDLLLEELKKIVPELEKS